jgi:hypothetical protein
VHTLITFLKVVELLPLLVKKLMAKFYVLLVVVVVVKAAVEQVA